MQQQKRNIEALKGRLEIAKTEGEKKNVSAQIARAEALVAMQDPILLKKNP